MKNEGRKWRPRKKKNNNKKIGENEKLLKIRFLGGWGVGGNTN